MGDAKTGAAKGQLRLSSSVIRLQPIIIQSKRRTLSLI